MVGGRRLRYARIQIHGGILYKKSIWAVIKGFFSILVLFQLDMRCVFAYAFSINLRKEKMCSQYVATILTPFTFLLHLALSRVSASQSFTHLKNVL